MLHLNIDDQKIRVVNFLKNAALDLACQSIIPNYESGEEDLTSIAGLMNDVAAKKEVILPEKFQFADVEHADAQFRQVANATYSIYNYLVQGASLMLEYAELENVPLPELAELVDEL